MIPYKTIPKLYESLGVAWGHGPTIPPHMEQLSKLLRLWIAPTAVDQSGGFDMVALPNKT